MDGYELGRSKVFLKYYHIEYLTKTYEYYLERVIRVQSAVRQWIGRKKLKRQKWIMARRLDWHCELFLATTNHLLTIFAEGPLNK